MLTALVRYASYPLILGGAAAAIIGIDRAGIVLWPWATLVALAGVVMVGLLERIAPYEPAWLSSHGDLVTDLWHNLFNLSLIQFASHVMFRWTDGVPPEWRLWPIESPYWAQLLIVALVVDLSLYAMHRLSHHVAWLWRLHAVHHSSTRLYWLNGERRHPLHALLMAAPGLAVLLILAAPSHLIAVWFAILTVQLAFQHANLDYTVGPLKAWLGTADVHRWHHKREFEDAQVNFGEAFMVWDRLLGTYFNAERAVGGDEVGLHDRTFPMGYLAQLRVPFQRSS